MNKICTKCNQSKDLSEFIKRSDYKDKYRSECNACSNLRSKKQYIQKHDDNLKRMKEYRKTHKEQKAQWCRAQRYTNSSFKIMDNCRRRIRYALNGNSKSNKTVVLIGCNTEELKNHLQQTAINNGYKNFNINNYSGQEYHIDHVIPCSKFNLECSYHQRLCFNWSNLQVLTKEKNLKKSDTIYPNALL